MSRHLPPALLAGVCLLTGCVRAPEPRAYTDEPRHFEVRLPAGYDDAASYPLVIALHSEGRTEAEALSWWDRGLYYAPNFILAAVRAPFRECEGFAWYSSYDPKIADPQQLRRASIATAEQRILDVLGEIEERYAVDNRQVYLHGFAQGATAALTVALRNPDDFTGVAADAGLPDTSVFALNRARGIDGLVVFLSAGSSDRPALVSGVTQVKRLLTRAGVEVEVADHAGGREVAAVTCRRMQNFFFLSQGEAPEDETGPNASPSRLETGPDEGDDGNDASE